VGASSTPHEIPHDLGERPSASVDRIADHAGVTRRTLERAFQKNIGRGVNAEFQRRRLERARDLLIQGDLPVTRIAVMLGYSAPSQFGRAFRLAYGTSPSQYRRQRH